MQRVVATVFAVIAAALAAGAQQPHPSFSATANLVVVPTVVVDRKGALVRGLDASSFELFEDGKPLPIEAFVPLDERGAGVDGRFIVLVLDNLRTPAEFGARVQSIAMRFVSRMGPGDDVSAITLERGRSSTAQSPAEVRAAINRFRPAFGDMPGIDAHNVAFGLETIASLAQQLGKTPHRRKVLVFIGAASIFSPHDESAFSDRGAELNPRWFDAIQATARDNVSVYVIDPSSQIGQWDDYSEGFAEQTGGRAWVNSVAFDKAVEQIWQESGSYYLLGYTPPINDHRLHKIDVKVKVNGATVRARRARG